MRFDMTLTTCPFCGTGCNFYLQTMDGEIIDVIPCNTHPVSEGQLCVLGRSAHRFVRNPDRLTKPLLKKGDKFEEISWPEAYAIVAKNLGGIKKEFGPDALGVFSSAKCTNEENYLIMKFARGGLGTNNVDHCARLCHASTVAGLAATFGSGAMTNSIGEIQEADCILVMGSNTTGQHPMVASKILRAREKGAKLIVIDPRRVPIAENADLHLQIKPGTNIALLNAMIRIILEKGLADTPFIRDRTEGFQELEAKVKERSLTEAEDITGIPVHLIEEAALTYARAKNAMIMYAMGVTQHVTGTEQVKAVANLAMVTGNIGKPSSGVNPLRGQNNVQGACDMGALPNVLSGYQQVSDPSVRARFQEKWGLQVPEPPGLTVVEMIDAAAAGKIKGMLIVGENPMISDPDINHVREALGALQFLVVQDIFLTETAQLADVVLPAVSFAEKEGTFTATDRRVQRVRKALEPVGESKPDWEIIGELAQKMGISGFQYASPREVMEEIRSLTPSYAGISYDRLDRGEVLHWPCPDEKHPGTPILHEKEFTRGKGKFFAVDYTPAPELPDEEFPYILTTGRVPFHFHGGSITRRIERLNQEISQGSVNMNPQDAKGLQIEDGQSVEVASRRGSIVIRARLSEEVEPGTVFIPMHFAEHAANVLTDARLDAEAKIPGFKVCSVRIRKLPERKKTG